MHHIYRKSNITPFTQGQKSLNSKKIVPAMGNRLASGPRPKRFIATLMRGAPRETPPITACILVDGQVENDNFLFKPTSNHTEKKKNLNCFFPLRFCSLKNESFVVSFRQEKNGRFFFCWRIFMQQKLGKVASKPFWSVFVSPRFNPVP